MSLFEREGQKGKSGNGGNNLASEAKRRVLEIKIWAVPKNGIYLPHSPE